MFPLSLDGCFAQLDIVVVIRQNRRRSPFASPTGWTFRPLKRPPARDMTLVVQRSRRGGIPLFAVRKGRVVPC